MADYNIIAPRGPKQPDSLKISPETMLNQLDKVADRRFQKEKWKAQQPNTIDKILSYAGTALDMYSKWEDIEGKKLNQENTKLQQQVSTLQLEQARIQAQVQNAKLEKDTKYSTELTTAMESGDPNKVYSVMMSNLEAVKNNPELTQMAMEFCASKGMDRESLDFFNPAEALEMRKIQAQTNRDIAKAMATAQIKASTKEQQEQQKHQKELDKTALNLQTKVKLNSKLEAAMMSLVPEGDAQNFDVIAKKLMNGDITCKTVQNWEEEFGNAMNNPNYSGPLEGQQDLLMGFSKTSNKMEDIDQYQTPIEGDNATLNDNETTQVRVADKNKLSNIYICTDETTGKSAILPMDSTNSQLLNTLLAEGARRKKETKEITAEINEINGKQEAVTNESTSNIADWYATAFNDNKALYSTNPSGAVQKMVAETRKNLGDKNIPVIMKNIVGSVSVNNPNEVLNAYYDARLSGKSEKESKQIATNVAIISEKETTDINTEPTKTTTTVNTSADNKENNSKKHTESNKLLSIKEKYNKADTENIKELQKTAYRKTLYDGNSTKLDPDLARELKAANIDTDKFSKEYEGKEDLADAITDKRLDKTSTDESVANFIREKVPEEFYKTEDIEKLDNTESVVEIYKRAKEEDKKAIREKYKQYVIEKLSFKKPNNDKTKEDKLKKFAEDMIAFHSPLWTPSEAPNRESSKSSNTITPLLMKAGLTIDQIIHRSKIRNMNTIINLIVDERLKGSKDDVIVKKIKEIIKLR